MTDAALLNEFVASFSKFDDMMVSGPVPSELDAGGAAPQQSQARSPPLPSIARPFTPPPLAPANE